MGEKCWVTSDKCGRKGGVGMPSFCYHHSTAEADKNLQWMLNPRGNFNQELYVCMVLSFLLHCLLVAKESIIPRQGEIRQHLDWVLILISSMRDKWTVYASRRDPLRSTQQHWARILARNAGLKSYYEKALGKKENWVGRRRQGTLFFKNVNIRKAVEIVQIKGDSIDS